VVSDLFFRPGFLAWFSGSVVCLSSEAQSDSTGGVVSEARTGKRFPLHLPIKIHREDTADDASGMTGNLSAAGVYIRADASLEVGSPVEFEITLPPEVTGARTMLSFSAAAA